MISENTKNAPGLSITFGTLSACLSKRKIIEPSLTAFTGCPFALVFICTFSESRACNRLTVTQKQITHGKSNLLTAKAITHSKSKSLTAKTNSLTSGLCRCYTELTTKACRNQKFFGLKLPIKYKQTRLNWCTPHGKNMALGVCVYKSYERSKSLVDTCSGSLA